ncbi:MAG TPA: ATP-binding protein, partial [Trueperaceae bacterium]
EGLRLHEDELANSLYHPAREAVTNAAKHSGASHIELLKELWDHTLTLQVRDDGKGLLEEYDQMDGMGIQSMRQRAELMGAELRIERSASAGTVACALPQ